MPETCACGKPAHHTTTRWWVDPRDEHQCCECYVRAGHPPADWHPGCLAVARG